MNFTRWLAALTVAATPYAAFAQSSVPPVPALDAGAASAAAPAASAIGPRLRSPAETGNRAVAPGDLRPERPVTPQISIPLGKKASPPTPREERVVQRGNPAATGGVDDAAARCESQVDAGLRASCRAKLAREEKARLPN